MAGSLTGLDSTGMDAFISGSSFSTVFSWFSSIECSLKTRCFCLAMWIQLGDSELPLGTLDTAGSGALQGFTPLSPCSSGFLGRAGLLLIGWDGGSGAGLFGCSTDSMWAETSTAGMSISDEEL